MRLVSQKPIGGVAFVRACAWRIAIVLALTVGLKGMVYLFWPVIGGWGAIFIAVHAREAFIWPTILYVPLISLYWPMHRRLRTLGLPVAYGIAVPILAIANLDLLLNFVRFWDDSGMAMQLFGRSLLSPSALWILILLIALLALAKPGEDGAPQSLRQRFGVPGQAAQIAIAVVCTVALFWMVWVGMFRLAIDLGYRLPHMPPIVYSASQVARPARVIAIVCLLVLIVQELRARRAA